mmetsp:Transcript_44884/g.66624  ORF Transcript_44884/g.66624 Transcript_44884/m.66624 type:complete len:242 (+) Transcript_44884:1983-2708(+)
MGRELFLPHITSIQLGFSQLAVFILLYDFLFLARSICIDSQTILPVAHNLLLILFLFAVVLFRAVVRVLFVLFFFSFRGTIFRTSDLKVHTILRTKDHDRSIFSLTEEIHGKRIQAHEKSHGMLPLFVAILQTTKIVEIILYEVSIGLLELVIPGWDVESMSRSGKVGMFQHQIVVGDSCLLMSRAFKAIQFCYSNSDQSIFHGVKSKFQLLLLLCGSFCCCIAQNASQSWSCALNVRIER